MQSLRHMLRSLYICKAKPCMQNIWAVVTPYKIFSNPFALVYMHLLALPHLAKCALCSIQQKILCTKLWTDSNTCIGLHSVQSLVLHVVYFSSSQSCPVNRISLPDMQQNISTRHAMVPAAVLLTLTTGLAAITDKEFMQIHNETSNLFVFFMQISVGFLLLVSWTFSSFISYSRTGSISAQHLQTWKY